MRTSVTLLLLCLFIASSNTPLCAQNEWTLCEGEVKRHYIKKEIPVDGKRISGNIYLEYEYAHPTCPSSADGFIKIHRLEFIPNSFFPTSLKFEEIGYSYYTGYGNLVQGDIDISGGKFPIEFSNLYGGKKYGFTVYMRSLNVTLISNYFSEDLIKVPKPNIKGKVYDESCPGAMDGIIELKQVSPADLGSTIVWDDGEEGFYRDGLAPDNYTGLYKYVVGDHSCCARAVYEVGSNSCVSEIFFCDFNLNNSCGYPIYIFQTSGCEYENGHIISLYNNSEIAYLCEEILTDGSINVECDLVRSPGLIKQLDPFIAINLYRPNEIRFPITNSGKINFTYPIDSIEVRSISVVIHKNDILDNLRISTGGTPEPMELLYQDSIAPSIIAISACSSDTIYLASELTINGGDTPYEYHWDLDNDGNYNDADSLFHPLKKVSRGMHRYGLRINDASGQIKEVQFNLNVDSRDTILFSIPELNVEDTSDVFISLCTEDEPFQLIIDQTVVLIDSAHLFDDQMMFDPSMVAPGYYFISLYTNSCSDPVFLSIDVAEPVDISLNDPEPYYLCDSTYDLGAMIQGDSSGIWVLDDSILIIGFEIDTGFEIEPGLHELLFFGGTGSCVEIDSVKWLVAEHPDATLKDEKLEVFTNSSPIVLDTLFTQNTVQGGSWSGGNYINAQGQFDPTGLMPGEYPVIYTVGSDACVASDTAYVIVRMSTGLDQYFNFEVKIYPNPASKYIVVEQSGEDIYQRCRVFDIYGRLVKDIFLQRSSLQQVDIDLTAGLYQFVFSDTKGNEVISVTIMD